MCDHFGRVGLELLYLIISIRIMKRLSIIIPIYNVEPYIERCLRSIEEQDIRADDYEIICINDGSPDESREVVVRIQREYNNIVLIDQENLGVSRARNIGIDRAVGTYLLFVDPDDYIDTLSFDGILRSTEAKKAQVSFLGFTFLNEDGTVRQKILNTADSNGIYSGIETYHLARGDGGTDPDRMWAVLFERHFLNANKLRFLPNVPYLEDGEFIARILCLAERCIFDGHSFYMRTARPGSATNSRLFYSDKATDGFLLAADNLKRYQNDPRLSEKQKRFLNQPILKFILLSINSSLSLKSFKKISSTIRTLKSLSFRKVNVEECKKNYYIYGKVYNFSLYLSVFVLFIYPRIKRLFGADSFGGKG
jgi:glycosyltransferase involved in cell wall biosynthesis